MLIYSKTINLFINRYLKESLSILKNEAQLEIKGKRFLYNQHLYPLSLVIFEDDKKWGYFEASFYKIALNKKLILNPNHDLTLDILKHELAHYLCFLKYGDSIQAHGSEFRDLCKSYGWGNEIYSATLPSDACESWPDKKSLKVQERIKKLMALQSSSNRFESELATIKVNELLIKYNLESNVIDDGLNFENIETYVLRVLHGKRKSAKYDSIATILNQFYVHTVFSVGTQEFYLEVIGDKVNVETADYVAKYLFNEFETLYKRAKKENEKLKGRTAKNNFFYGLADGYSEKIKESKKSVNKSDLIKVNLKTDQALSMAYPRLRGSKSSLSYDANAKEIGRLAGEKLSIRPGIKAGFKKLLLGI